VNGYRFSIIPAGAVTDPQLEPRDLQVLCLIGRHTDHNGWCRRSQVKMADELRCGRATVQRALERLYEANYLQRRLEGTRGGEPPSEGEQPFRAHSYRVLMDREAAADHLAEIEGVPAGEHGGVPTSEHGGVPTSEQGVPAIDGHGVPTHARAPTELPSSKGTPLNSQRGPSDQKKNAAGKEGFSKTGCREYPVKGSAAEPLNSGTGSRQVGDKQPNCSDGEQLRDTNTEPLNCPQRVIVPTASLAEFQAAWGTSAIDNVNRTMRAWGALTLDQRQAAMAGIKPFKAELNRAKRTHVPAGWRYIEERRWEMLAVSTGGWVDVKPLCRDWWGLLFAKIERGEKVAWFAQCTLNNPHDVPVKQDDMPTFDQLACLESYPCDGETMKAWRPWLEAHGVKIPYRDRLWVFLPGTAPPLSGSIWKAKRNAA
jgi:hypothetical protein